MRQGWEHERWGKRLEPMGKELMGSSKMGCKQKILSTRMLKMQSYIILCVTGQMPSFASNLH